VFRRRKTLSYSSSRRRKSILYVPLERTALALTEMTSLFTRSRLTRGFWDHSIVVSAVWFLVCFIGKGRFWTSSIALPLWYAHMCSRAPSQIMSSRFRGERPSWEHLSPSPSKSHASPFVKESQTFLLTKGQMPRSSKRTVSILACIFIFVGVLYSVTAWLGT
jgi:hypothetical protein